MPIMETEQDGKPGFKYGESGKVYTYEPGDRHARQMARKKAAKQGRAIEAEQKRRGK